MLIILGFCYSNLTRENGGFELASTISLDLQTDRLPKCASYLKYEHSKTKSISWGLQKVNERWERQKTVKFFHQNMTFSQNELLTKNQIIKSVTQTQLLFWQHCHPSNSTNNEKVIKLTF